ncbi:hypothetical protein QQ045_017945 [Rhodiola kirilowii]
MQALVDSSPETFVKWDVTPLDNGASHVNRVFWAFAEPLYAFKHCRPVLSIDGMHMYEKWVGSQMVGGPSFRVMVISLRSRLNTGTHNEGVHLYVVEVVKRWMDDTYFQSEAMKSWMTDNDHPRKSRYSDNHIPIHQPRRLNMHLYEK